MNPPGPVARPLVPLTLALMGGIASPALGLNLHAGGVTAAACLVLGAVGVLWWRGRSPFWLSFGLFWLVGVGLYQYALQPPLPPHHVAHLPQDTSITLIGTIDQPPESQAERLRFDLAANSWLSPQGWQPATGKVRVYAPLLSVPLTLRDRVALRVKLHPVENRRNPGSFNRQRFLARQQIYTLATLTDAQHLVRMAGNAELSWGTGVVERIRPRALRFLEQQPQPSRALYKALLLGDRREITPEIREWFSRTGTSHLLAISGLHLGMVAAMAFWLGFWLLRRSAWLLLRINAVKLATLLAIIPVWGYGLLAGGSPATQRAEIMILVYLLLVLLDRHRDLYNALALAALVILLISPLTLFSLSFQLSFLSVVGLTYLVPKWMPSLKSWWLTGETPAQGWRRLPLWGVEALAICTAATLATLPLVAASFNLIPAYGIVVNLLAIPLVSSLALPLGLGALAALPWFPELARIFLTLGSYPLEWGLQVIAGAARLPYAALTVPTPTLVQIGAYYVLLICLFPPRRTAWSWGGVGLAVVLLVGSLGYPTLSMRLAPHLEVTGLDTPGEMAALVTFPRGAQMVVSAGAPTYQDYPTHRRRIIASYLHYRQIRRVDYLVALASSARNAPSLLAITRNFDLGQFWYEGGRVPAPAFWELKNWLGDRQLPVLNLALTAPPGEIQEVAVKVFQPPGEIGDRPSGPVALQLIYQGQRLMFLPPGRREWQKRLLTYGPRLACEVAWVGSEIKQSKLWQALLTLLNPRIVVVTGSGEVSQSDSRNDPGNRGVYFTGQGAVTVAVTGSRLTIHQWSP